MSIAHVEGCVASIMQAVSARPSICFNAPVASPPRPRPMCRRCEDYDVRIIDTRKTAPGLRNLDKYAVRVGRRTQPPPQLS